MRALGALRLYEHLADDLPPLRAVHAMGEHVAAENTSHGRAVPPIWMMSRPMGHMPFARMIRWLSRGKNPAVVMPAGDLGFGKHGFTSKAFDSVVDAAGFFRNVRVDDGSDFSPSRTRNSDRRDTGWMVARRRDLAAWMSSLDSWR